MRRYDKWLNEKKYKAKLNLLAKIHREIDPIINLMRGAAEGTVQREFLGYDNKRQIDPYSLASFSAVFNNVKAQFRHKSPTGSY